MRTLQRAAMYIVVLCFGVQLIALHAIKKSVKNLEAAVAVPSVTYHYTIEKVVDMSTPTPICELTQDERALVEQVVACEAGADTFEGQLAVAQCFYNSILIEGTSVLDVFNKYGYATYARTVTNENRLAVSAVFDYGAKVTDLPIQWYVTFKAEPNSWHFNNATKAGEWGAHSFYYNAALVSE